MLTLVITNKTLRDYFFGQFITKIFFTIGSLPSLGHNNHVTSITILFLTLFLRLLIIYIYIYIIVLIPMFMCVNTTIYVLDKHKSILPYIKHISNDNTIID